MNSFVHYKTIELITDPNGILMECYLKIDINLPTIEIDSSVVLLSIVMSVMCDVFIMMAELILGLNQRKKC